MMELHLSAHKAAERLDLRLYQVNLICSRDRLKRPVKVKGKWWVPVSMIEEIEERRKLEKPQWIYTDSGV